ncbi:MAG: type IV secretion system DNA-binding domain-containing protein [Verrucomicrobiae bacterium]|nr:type IV secretion system DNA-binding domain-containing protein [Verrucomicrobiae bacterium]
MELFTFIVPHPVAGLVDSAGAGARLVEWDRAFLVGEAGPARVRRSFQHDACAAWSWTLPAEEERLQIVMITIGTHIAWGTRERLSEKELLKHLYILGKTGSGKSTALLNVLGGWMETGNGAALVDPHGDLAGDFMQRIPRSVLSRVVVIDPSDRENPIAWNPLWRVPESRRPVVAQGLVGAFRGVWRDSWGPRMEYILLNGLRLLLDAGDESLLGLPRLLVDPGYRRMLLRRCMDPVVYRFWREEFDGWDERFRREAIAPIQNKVGQFLGDPLMRSILGQSRSRLDFRLSMDRGRIFVVSLSKGLVGEGTANLFGALLVASFHEAALSRAEQPEENRRPFLLVVDEFQNVVTDRFASILSEARKYGLGIVLSHQYLGQLLPEIRSAALGNVGSMLLFRTGGADAEILAKELGAEWSPSRFADLMPYHAILFGGGSGLPAGREVKTLPPSLPVRASDQTDQICVSSAQRFARPVEQVREKQERWFSRRF